jgi:hypothetical protein
MQLWRAGTLTADKRIIAAFILSVLAVSMVSEILVVNALSYPTAQTVEPLLKINLVYAYAQTPYATVILEVKRVADLNLNSSTILADAYGVSIFSNGTKVGTQEIVFLDGGNLSETLRNPLNSTIQTNLQAYSRIDYAPKKVGESFLESCSITIDNSADNISVTVDWLDRITIHETTSIVNSLSIQEKTLVQQSLEEFSDGFIYNSVVSQRQLSHINLFHPISDLPPSLQFITVTPNGDVVPSTDELKRKENTYILTRNFSSTIIVEKDSAIIDGGNYTLQGPCQNQNGIAIILKASNLTVKNMRIINWNQGILGESNNNTIENIELIDNLQAILVHGDDFIINHNMISSSRTALIFATAPYREQGDSNIVTQNQIRNNFLAFDVTNSNGTTITTNNVVNNSVILALSGSTKNSVLYNNNFINNSCAASVPSPFPPIVIAPFVPNVVPISPAGQWDDGKVGNYWSNYLTTYPQAKEKDHTGVGNTPYIENETITYGFSVNGYAAGSQSWAINGTAVVAIITDNHPLIAPVSVSTLSLIPPLSTASSLPSETVIIVIILVVVALLTVSIAVLADSNKTDKQLNLQMEY